MSFTNGPDGEPRCRVHYTVEPIGGGPVGFGGSAIPLPWLDMEDVTVDYETGKPQFHIRNKGTAAWANHDLRIRGRGESQTANYDLVFPQFCLDIGQSMILSPDDLHAGRPLELCWLLDPEDQVLERYEQTGALYHGYQCPRLPDFTITEAKYDPIHDQLQITVQNAGRGAVEEALVDLRLDYEDGGKVLLSVNMDDLLTLGEWDSAVLSFGPPAVDSDRLAAGYTVIVDPNDHYLEKDEDNNIIAVRGGERLRQEWHGAILR